MKLNPKKTIKKNINRRSKIVDDTVYTYKKFPMPTWVELSLIDVCNRSCSFCPKSDASIAPDTHQMMNRRIIDKIHDDLKEIDYKGSVALCGYGEPLLHKDINYITQKLSKVASVEIITNGDVLSSKLLQNLYLSKVSKVVISMYDGPEQIEKFTKMARNANVPEEMIILRDRWYGDDKDFGVKLTNRSGTIKSGNQVSLGTYSNCYYPSYQFLIDWNGNVFLCPQDWQRRHAMGNIMQESMFEVWTGKIMTKYRKNLLKGKRCDSPCKECNADGTLLGYKHAKIWNEIY
tara:strand:- start:157 stop:1026 length:870 start_codon:yes stop_codon:yes gene_type:complete